MYLGGVPVESTTAGSALLYRLLETYPPEKLLIVEAFESPSTASHRLPGVTYAVLPKPWNRGWRFLRTRLPWAFWPIFKVYANSVAKRCGDLVRDFRPEALVTVHERFTWVIADRVALRFNLPLHLILHDEWFRNITFSEGFREPSNCYFSEVYQRASSRLCVSPYMEESYRVGFGREGTVLYPSRSVNALVHVSPPERLRSVAGQPVAMYAGNIFQADFLKSMQCVAEALASMGGKLVLYTTYSKANAIRNGLTAENVEFRETVRWKELADRIRAEAHFLFLPMSFDENDRPNTAVSFPSKIVDYTGTGVPLLIYGPSYCSAVRWANDYPGTAEVVHEKSPQLLAEAVRRLVEDGSHRFRLGLRSLEVGRRCFSHESAEKILYNHLARLG
jgi:glycosyltransferase involved in cell wall biosynthesis